LFPNGGYPMGRKNAEFPIVAASPDAAPSRQGKRSPDERSDIRG
jgi:hypothetical protein